MINLDNLKSLSKNNHAFIREILEVYLMNTPKDVESMESAVESGDFEMVRYFAHKLKSSSFTIGFNDGFKVFQEIEHDIKNEVGEVLGYIFVNTKVKDLKFNKNSTNKDINCYKAKNMSE